MPRDRRLRRTRRVVGWLVTALLVLVIAVQVVYLARRPLFERLLLSTVERELAAVLDAEVTIESLGGNWLTTLVVRGVDVKGSGIVAEVTGGEIDASLRPWRFASGDLGGLRLARVRAQRVVIDTTATAKTPEPPPTTDDAPIDLDPLLQLLPAGAEVTVEQLVVRGPHGERAGRFTARVPARTRPADELEIDARHAETAISATLRRDCRIGVRLAAEQAAGWARPWAKLPDPEIDGGSLVARAEVDLRGALDARANLRLRGVTVRGREVERCRVDVALHGTRLEAPHVELRAPGVELDAEDLAFDYGAEDPLATLRGRLRLVADDPRGYATLAPEEARAWWPDRLVALAHATGRRVQVDELRIVGLGLDVAASSQPFDHRLETPAEIDATIRIVDPTRLPLPDGVPLRPTAGSRLAASARVGREEIAGTLRVDVTARDADARTVRATGTVVARGFERWSAEPDLRFAGDLLAPLNTAALTGELVWENPLVSVQALRVATDDGTVEITGRADVTAGELADLAASAHLDAALRGVRLAPWRERLGIEGLAATADAQLEWRGATGVLSLKASGTASGVGPDPAAPIEWRIAAGADATGASLTELEMRGGGTTVTATGAVAGLTVETALRDPDSVLRREISLTGSVAAPDLAALQLARLGAPEIAGGCAARFAVRGTLASPEPEATVDLTAVRVAIEPAIDELNGRIRVRPDSAALEDLAFELDGHAMTLAGGAAIAGDAIEVKQLRLSQAGGGQLVVNGAIPTNDPAAIASALLAGGDVSVELREIALDPWLAQPGASARVSGEARWRGGDRAPVLTADLNGTARGLLGADGPEVRVELAARADATAVALPKVIVHTGGGQLSGAARLDSLTLTELLERPDAIRSAPLRGELTMRDIDLSALLPRRPGQLDVGGFLAGSAALAGTIAEPKPRLDLTLTDGHVRPPGGPRVSELRGDVIVQPDEVKIVGIEGELAEGPIQIAGTFKTPGLLAEHWRDGELDLHVRGERAQLHRKDGLKLRGNIDLTAKGKADDILVAGTVELVSSRLVSRIPFFDVRSAGGAAVRQGINIPGPDVSPFRIRLDVDVTTKEPIGVKTNVYTGGVTASLKLSGPLNEPVLHGTISGVNADLRPANVKLPGMTFRATTLLIRFERENPRFPTVNLVAIGRRHGYDVTLIVRGRYDQPEILLSSNPPLPAEDLAVFVTTGARPAALEQQGVRGVGTLVGSYLVDEIADYLFGSESTEAKEGFMERFTFETGTEISPNGNESVVVEFRVLDAIYLQGERDVHEDINFGVVFRVRFR